MTVVPKTRLRVGALGAAKVLRKTWVAVHEAGHELTAVGCRDKPRGEKCVEELHAAMPFASRPLVSDYESVVASPNVDVVYIAIPVTARHKWMLECAKQGKHVVGEKPTAVSSLELREWLQHFAAKRLLFVDGTMLSHSRRIQEVCRACREIGRLRRMEAHFAFMASEEFLRSDIRLDPAQEPMGALGDLGWYCVRYFLHLVDFALPDAVMGRVAQRSGAKHGISAFSGELLFTVAGEPVVGAFFCTFHAAHEQLVRIKGDDGIIVVHGAINPTDEAVPTFSVERTTFEGPTESPSFRREVETRRCDEDCTFQAVQLWRDVGLALMHIDPGEPPVVVPERSERWARMAWATQHVCDKLMESAQKSAEWAAVAPAEENNAIATTTTTTKPEASSTQKTAAPERAAALAQLKKQGMAVVEL
ncbi:oxidoreductase-like protein [Trypanosoma conorhini]|uniref:Oxidoreductase-like protein n=1 Tax=Trypanosoma conorhini TaxID=83891 RepID=A0A422QCA9_9TRYP|nr:oxidoreductase-like protein [Trypanosoma conorhini]RNF27613.1 oxidoreductase-like protein [Trypanosoma conorhini]